jgi:starch synthase (maltosyl-transferring)
MLPPPPSSFLPRIYYLYPEYLVTEVARDAHLARCAALGFDHLLLAPSRQERIAACEPEPAMLRDWAERARTHGLQLLVDLDLACLGAESGVVDAHPEWFEQADDDLPDPRRPPQPGRGKALRSEQAGVAEAVRQTLEERVLRWIDAGASGCRCTGLGLLSPARWRELMAAARARNPDFRFLAWTPGCTPEQLSLLAGCGFDASFSSLAWWDVRARWLVEEHARLMAVASPIAFPDSPWEAAIARAPGFDDPGLRRVICERALRLAAALGNGWLVPMGFEYGWAGLGAAEPGFDFDAHRADAPFDLSPQIAAANAFIEGRLGQYAGTRLCQLSAAGAPAAVLLRMPQARTDEQALLVMANADIAAPVTVEERQWLERTDGFVPAHALLPAEEAQQAGSPCAATRAGATVALAPGAVLLYEARRLPPIVLPTGRGRQATVNAARAPRIAIEAVSPTVDGGRFAVKRVVGDLVQVEADVFMDGHDKLAVALLWRAADEPDWREVRMHSIGNDRWAASLPLMRVGRHLFAVEAWRDAFATYRDELEKKSAAGLDVSLELEEGRLLVEAAAEHAQQKGIVEAAATLAALAKTLKVPKSRAKAAGSDTERIAALLSEPTAEAMRAADARPFAVRSDPPYRIEADRGAARFASWYELFPRSQSGDPQRHGTFDDVIRRLPAIRAMDFDTLYFPPIHPIGRKHRKGRNNSLTPTPDDPGSPYAIGSEEGGHDAIHPQLGTLDDFRRLRDAAAEHGLELALDFAIQCSPDHPWLKQHPEWFDWRPDGSIRYAENPPKKYQDIVNVDFYAEGAIPGLWNALRDVVLFWAREGVRVFRVDNPHTKSLPFWEWMIAEVRARFPDTIFLSEAFTRPRMMYRLAKLGFTQSYTYFTWRHTKQEFIDYLTELSTEPVSEFFRPNFFVNTPDINPPFLQKSGRPGFLIRAALATTLSGLWGMYSGFELCEATPVPGKEEYLDSEKYEIRAWDWERPGNIVAEITQLNRIRRENAALQSHLGIRFLHASNGHILYFLKSTKPQEPLQLLGDNTVLVAINLDPFHAQEADIELPLWEFGLPEHGTLDVTDLLSGAHFAWHGKHQHLRLDPFERPYAIWRLRQQGV